MNNSRERMLNEKIEIYDLVVVGGGPAGSAAAFTAAKEGLRVCLIDKSNFPREKLCGGLITQRSKNVFETVFGQELDSNIISYSDHVDFYSDGKFLASTEGYSRLFFTMRKDFDDYLLRLAKDAGTTLKLGVKIDRLDFVDKVVHLKNGDTIGYRFLIGADGVNSQVAKELFGSSFNKNTIGFGLEAEVPREMLPTHSENVEIDFGAAKWGYGWVFPKKSTFTIGVGGIHRLNSDIKTSFANFLSAKGLDVKKLNVKGQFIPFGDYRSQPGRDLVLLCGDAAGIVDPITGEGIAYAMQSGNAAAVSVSDDIHGRGNAFDLYRKRYKEITKSIRQAKIWRYLIFPKLIRKPFAWAFSDAGTLQKGYLDILAGEHEYNRLYGLFILQTAKAIRKLFRFLTNTSNNKTQ